MFFVAPPVWVDDSVSTIYKSKKEIMILSHSQKILNELKQSLGRVAVHTRKVNLKSQKKNSYLHCVPSYHTQEVIEEKY